MEKDGLAVLEASSVCNLLQVLVFLKPAQGAGFFIYIAIHDTY